MKKSILLALVSLLAIPSLAQASTKLSKHDMKFLSEFETTSDDISAQTVAVYVNSQPEKIVEQAKQICRMYDRGFSSDYIENLQVKSFGAGNDQQTINTFATYYGTLNYAAEKYYCPEYSQKSKK